PCPPQTCPVGFEPPVEDCLLQIDGLPCDSINSQFIQTTHQISIHNGKFRVCAKVEYIPMPPCPTGPAGGALSPAYAADLGSTADADPTAGKMRFDNVTQNAATALRVSNASADGGSWASALARIANSTNP